MGVFYSHLDPSKSDFTPARNLNHKPGDNYSLAANAQGKCRCHLDDRQPVRTSSRHNGKNSAKQKQSPLADPCECCAVAFFSPDFTLSILYREKAGDIRDMHVLERTKDQTVLTEDQFHTLESERVPMTGAFLSGTKQGRSTLVSSHPTESLCCSINPGGREKTSAARLA